MSLIRKHGAVLQAWACLDLVQLWDLKGVRPEKKSVKT